MAELLLQDQCALVTGGAGGLGHAIAQSMLSVGASVVIADLPGPRLATAVSTLHPNGKALAFEADMSTPSAARDVVRKTVERLGALHILVNCVGVMQTVPFAEVTEADWNRVIDINLTGVFHTLQESAKHIALAGGGSIVNVSSVAGRSGRPTAAAYAASKAGLLSLTKSAAMAYAPAIRVNAVCPGVFLTDMWEGIMRERDSKFGAGAGRDYLDEVASRTAMGRVGNPPELASVVLFLVSEMASFVTGQAINVDGGLEMD